MLTDDTVRPGDTLGRYELLSCLGRGGMAAVWAARHRGAHGFSKIVAVKTMLPELSNEADFQRMFLREARVVSRIRHPNVVETLDLGEEDGLLYLVMEWIDGETLGTVMRAAAREGGVPLALGLKIIIDACAGVHAAHELRDEENRPVGLVHRDVSPPNVLVSYAGQVKLADFGVAKTLELNNACTQTGLVKGKFRYIAPEQLSGGPIDRRADIFALGITLYQLTTGRHPWPADTAMMAMRKILSEPPVAPADVVADYPAALADIVLKALERDPADRFQSATEMSLALEELAREVGLLATTREVGAYVSRLLEARGAARRETMRKATREADTRLLGDGSIRRIDETWEALAADSSMSVEPVPSGGESVHPWTREPSRPPELGSAAGTLVPPFGHLARFATLSRSKGWKRALWLGGTALLLLSAYGLGGRRSSDVAAASEPSRASSVAAARGDRDDALAKTSETAAPVASSAASAQAARSALPHAPPTPIRLRAPSGVRAQPSSASHRATGELESEPNQATVPEPDVGF